MDNKGKRQFFLAMATLALMVNLTGFGVGYFDKNLVDALVAVGLYDVWIGGVFLVMWIADKLYPKNEDKN